MSSRFDPDATSPPRRGRGAGLKIAGASLASLLAIATPIDEGGPLCLGEEPAPALSGGGPEIAALPAGWPAPTPELTNDHETWIWSLVWKHCARFSVTGQALTMYHVLWEESRLLPEVKSACGRYFGIGQFVRSTFNSNVAEMKKRGLIPKESRFSPLDADQAIEVMAWMWSQGYMSHWGPYRRVSRRLASRTAKPPRPEPGPATTLAEFRVH